MERIVSSEASSRGPVYQGCPLTLTNRLIALVEKPMSEYHDPDIGAGAAITNLDDIGLGPQRVAEKYRMRCLDLIEAKIGKQGAQRGVAHGKANHQAETETTINEDPPKFTRSRIFCVQMQRLGIVRNQRKKQVVGFRHGATNFVNEMVANGELFEVTSAHGFLPVLVTNAEGLWKAALVLPLR